MKWEPTCKKQKKKSENYQNGNLIDNCIELIDTQNNTERESTSKNKTNRKLPRNKDLQNCWKLSIIELSGITYWMTYQLV